MIQPAEIRIGNWVNIAGHPREVTYVNAKGCGVSDKDFVSFEGVLPIPITDDLLLQTGFEKDRYGYKTDQFALNQYEQVYYLRIPPGMGFGRPIYHLHQLQNLYYEICGKEYKFAERPSVSAVNT